MILPRELLQNCLIIVALGAACLIGWTPLSTIAATILILWWPGATIVRAISRFDHIPGRGTLAIAASITLTVIPLSWFWRYTNTPFSVIAFATALNLLLNILAFFIRRCAEPQSSDGPKTKPPMLLMVIGIWTGACVLGAFWIPTALGRTAPNAAHDYVKHHAIVLSLNQHPLPLRNVFCALEPETPYFYYEYYYLLAASIRSMTGLEISIGLSLGLVSAVLAVVVIRLVYWIAFGLWQSRSGALLSAACVSVLGGWDIVPVLIRVLGGQSMPVVLDSWCPVAWRIHNLATQFYWCPQHVAAICAMLLAAYALMIAPLGRFWLVLGPCLGASLFGSSVYVAIPVFLAAAVYCIGRIFNGPGERWRIAVSVLVIAVVGAVLMGVQALGYQEMANRFDGGLTFSWERFPLALFGRLLSPGPPANFLDAWWLTLIDFGLPAVALVLIHPRIWKTAWSNPGIRFLLLCGGIGFLAMFTMRSSINPIDYGFRVAIMPTMIVAAIFAGRLIRPEAIRPRFLRLRRPILITGIILSLPVGLYEAPLSAARSLLQKQPDANDAGAYSFLRNETPRDAIVQGAPTAKRVTLTQIVSRQIGASDPNDWHVRVFWPPNPKTLQQAVALAESAFNTTASKIAHAALQELGVTHVLVGTVEKDRYGEVPQFVDETYFERAYEDQTASVYRLKKHTVGD